MTQLTENQITFICRNFFPSYDTLPGMPRIAKILLTEGKCIVAGTLNIFRGHTITEFIHITEAENTIDCLHYSLELEEFLESEYFFEGISNAFNSNEFQEDIETIEQEIQEAQQRLDSLKEQFSWIKQIVDAHSDNEIIK